MRKRFGAIWLLAMCLACGEVHGQSADFNRSPYFPPPPWLPSANTARPPQSQSTNDTGVEGELRTSKETTPAPGGDVFTMRRPPDNANRPSDDTKRPLDNGRRPPEKDTGEPAVPPENNPFGFNLFQGQFVAQQEAGLNPNYIIAPGDRIVVNLWGAHQFAGQVVVDAQGNIFIPDVGPIHVGGITNRNLNQAVSTRVNGVFARNVMVYTSLATAQPIGVMVAGFVARPGRYAGVPSASILYFIDRAGGILEEQGSYRDIRILRDNKTVAKADLYDFLLEGKLPKLQFEEGDTILVGRRKYAIITGGDVQNPATFEFMQETIAGDELSRLAAPTPGVTHVAISGIRKGEPISSYLSIADFGKSSIRNGDRMRFTSDGKPKRIFVHIEGQHKGANVLTVRLGAKLSDVLNLIEVDPNGANTSSIFIRRRSVAEAQKKAIEDSLFRLQRSVLTARSASDGIAQIRLGEARLIAEFVERASKVKPEGRVVLVTKEGPSDITLEQDDVIVVPRRTDVVQVSGEVTLPHDVVYQPGSDVARYIEMAGGFSERADADRILLVRQSGEVLDGNRARIKPGDYIMVMPIVDGKYFQLGKEIAQILYQIAISAAVVLNL